MGKKLRRSLVALCTQCQCVLAPETEGWLCTGCDAPELRSRFAASVGAAFRAIGRAMEGGRQ